MTALPTLHEQWLARAERFERIAAKLQQRARDIRHTAEMVRLPFVPPLKCEECEAHDGEEHYAFCLHPAALRGELVS